MRFRETVQTCSVFFIIELSLIDIILLLVLSFYETVLDLVEPLSPTRCQKAFYISEMIKAEAAIKHLFLQACLIDNEYMEYCYRYGTKNEKKVRFVRKT